MNQERKSGEWSNATTAAVFFFLFFPQRVVLPSMELYGEMFLPKLLLLAIPAPSYLLLLWLSKGSLLSTVRFYFPFGFLFILALIEDAVMVFPSLNNTFLFKSLNGLGRMLLFLLNSTSLFYEKISDNWNRIVSAISARILITLTIVQKKVRACVRIIFFIVTLFSLAYFLDLWMNIVLFLVFLPDGIKEKQHSSLISDYLVNYRQGLFA